MTTQPKPSSGKLDAIAAISRLRRNSLITRRLTSEWPSMAQLRSDVKIIINELPTVEKAIGIAQRIAAMDENTIRDYEQGLCFFCYDPEDRHNKECIWIEARDLVGSP